MQADHTVLSLRPGGGNRGRTSAPRFDFGLSDLRPQPVTSLASLKVDNFFKP